MKREIETSISSVTYNTLCCLGFDRSHLEELYGSPLGLTVLRNGPEKSKMIVLQFLLSALDSRRADREFKHCWSYVLTYQQQNSFKNVSVVWLQELVEKGVLDGPLRRSDFLYGSRGEKMLSNLSSFVLISRLSPGSKCSYNRVTAASTNADANIVIHSLKTRVRQQLQMLNRRVSIENTRYKKRSLLAGEIAERHRLVSARSNGLPPLKSASSDSNESLVRSEQIAGMRTNFTVMKQLLDKRATMLGFLETETQRVNLNPFGKETSGYKLDDAFRAWRNKISSLPLSVCRKSASGFIGPRMESLLKSIKQMNDDLESRVQFFEEKLGELDVPAEAQSGVNFSPVMFQRTPKQSDESDWIRNVITTPSLLAKEDEEDVEDDGGFFLTTLKTPT